METFDQSAAVLLKRASEAVMPRADSPEARRDIVRAIAEALVPEQVRAPRRWPYLIAAGVVFAMAAAWFARPAPVVEPVPTPPIAVVPEPLPVPKVVPVETHERVFASGARVSWERGAELEFKDSSSTVLLRRGQVAADGAEAGVLVDCADSEVFVRGRTVVRAGAGCDGRALVRVESGESTVRSRGVQMTLKAGEEWPRCGATKAPPAPVPAFGLEQQNALYENALNAQRAGKTDDAVRALENLLHRAPDSVLAETALAQEFRWLAPVDAVRAKAAAQRYLSTFPMGPARAEAERLLK